MQNCSPISDPSTTSEESYEKQSRTKKFNAAILLTGLSGLSIFGGFTYAVGAAKKLDPQMFDEGMRSQARLPMGGTALAMRALGWGSLYAISGVTLFCYFVWKISGSKDIKEFRYKMGSVLPNIPKKDNEQGRTEFDNLTDLLQYVIEEDKKKKTTDEAKQEKDPNGLGLPIL